MSLEKIALFVFVSVLMSVGQLLFKVTANQWTSTSSMLTMAFIWPLMGSLAVYATACTLWIFALRNTELSKAMPFIATAYIIAPLASAALFDDAIQPAYWLGAAFIVTGIAICGYA